MASKSPENNIKSFGVLMNCTFSFVNPPKDISINNADIPTPKSAKSAKVSVLSSKTASFTNAIEKDEQCLCSAGFGFDSVLSACVACNSQSYKDQIANIDCTLCPSESLVPVNLQPGLNSSS